MDWTVIAPLNPFVSSRREWVSEWLRGLWCRYIQLLGVVPTDAVVEKRLGEMSDADGDKTEAYTYFYNVYVVLRYLLFLAHCCSIGSSNMNVFCGPDVVSDARSYNVEVKTVHPVCKFMKSFSSVNDFSKDLCVSFQEIFRAKLFIFFALQQNTGNPGWIVVQFYNGNITMNARFDFQRVNCRGICSQ